MKTTIPFLVGPSGKVLALLGALLASLVLFLLIPLTQFLDDVSDEIVEYREMNLVAPPPPPVVPPPDEIETVEQQELPQPPQPQRQVTEVPVQQLPLSLSPGVGVSLVMGVPNLEGMGEMDLVADIERIFNFDELAEVPRLLNARMIRADFPRELARRGIKEAKVVMEILIDRGGRVRVERILSISKDHPRLREAARKAASQARFSVTRVDGQAVVVRGKFPLTLRAPR